MFDSEERFSDKSNIWQIGFSTWVGARELIENELLTYFEKMYQITLFVWLPIAKLDPAEVWLQSEADQLTGIGGHLQDW